MKDEKGDSVNFLNAEQDKNIIVIVLKTNLFVRFLEESEDTKKSFRSYLTFNLKELKPILFCFERIFEF